MGSESGRLRSSQWFNREPRAFGHNSRTLQNGYEYEEFVGRPVIGIVNTWSDLATCHGHLPEVAAAVRRGVLQAGGFPVELPAMAVPEMMTKPSSMLYRNFLAMEVEELLRCNPIDGVVLLGGCDKTTPALLMGAISMDLPAIYVPAGFMLHGLWRGEQLGSGVDAWKYGPELQVGRISRGDWSEIEAGSARTVGTCNTMGTASTMTAVAEAMGMTLKGASSLAAVDALQRRLAHRAGSRIVEMVAEDLRPSSVLEPASLVNAATVGFALAGSTNAAIHLLAIAGRCGFDGFDLRRLDAIAARTPVLANIQPSGAFLMENFYEAGGLPALMERLGDLLQLDCRTVSGKTLGESIGGARVLDERVIGSRDAPFARGAFAALFGNLAPDGCVIKPSAASSDLLKHRGRAVVFENKADLHARINDPELDVDKDSVLVLRNAGPLGGPGMPEWGMLPIPRKLLAQGVRDMVRISDARMSGTSFGTIVLHVAPEAYVGGPLALVRNGDFIELDVEARRLDLKVGAGELSRRQAAWRPPQVDPKSRGYLTLFSQHVSQAHQGCDFDFLVGREPQGARSEVIHSA